MIVRLAIALAAAAGPGSTPNPAARGETALWPGATPGPNDACHGLLEELDCWITDLGSPSFAEREAAVTRLYAAGPAALQALQRLAPRDDFEASIRAREIVSRIERLYLVGAQIELTVAPDTLRWDQPATLQVRIANPNGFPIRLPFLIADRERIDRSATAQQVGAVLDIADFVEVRAPDDTLVELTVDDFRGFDDVETALDVRVFGEPSSWLAAGESTTLVAPAFNRGVARFKMLEAGTYRLRFRYVPEWDVAELRDRQVGMIASPAAPLTITAPAPAALQRRGPLIETRLQLDGDDVVWEVHNVHDRSVGIHTNFGPRPRRTHAHVTWMWNASDHPAVEDGGPALPERMTTLQPDATLELLRVPVATIRRLPGFPTTPTTLRGQYGNVLDRAALDTLYGEAELQRWRGALPLPTFVGHSTTNDLLLPAP